jgi:endonuclease G
MEASDPVHERAATALEKLKTGRPISPEEAFGLEAIVLPDQRPVVFIHNNVFDPVPMDIWSHLNTDEVHARLEPLFPSIGRIELPATPTIPYGGTGFVVGPNLLMTNRHVARLFADGLGTRITYHTGGSAIDFKREDGTPPTDTSAHVDVTGVLMIHPYWDMALLKVAALPASAKPLPLSILAPEGLVGRDVIVVGYPARDYRNALDVQDRVFQKKYGVKRMQPGKAQARERYTSFENLVDAMTHDSSTLGGNSGSALIDLQTGTVVGLHFAGEYLKANYGVPTYELARDQRVVDAAVNFQGRVEPTSAWGDSWLRAEHDGEPTESEMASQQPALTVQTLATQSPTSATATATYQFTIPGQVVVSVNVPRLAVIQPATAVDDSAEEKVPVMFPNLESRNGYQDNFLALENGVTIPMPQLTAAGKAAVAKLDDGSRNLNYQNFSVVMHKKRRLALFTAANVDWRPQMRAIKGKKPTRKELNGFTANESEDWVVDPRIPLEHQLPDYFYRKSAAFDRGHLVRRDDVAWGKTFKEMQKGNGDTFHMTNCSPQTPELNRSNLGDFNWGDLENMIQAQTQSEKVCVFSGPVLADEDLYFHGLLKSGVPVSVQIPTRFWKIIVANHAGRPAAFGFVLDQDLADVDLHEELIVPDAWKQYVRPIAEIEDYLNGLAKLTAFKGWDQYHAD